MAVGASTIGNPIHSWSSGIPSIRSLAPIERLLVLLTMKQKGLDIQAMKISSPI